MIGQIVAEQVEVASAMEGDVITLVGGLNDTLRPKCDMGRVTGLLEEAGFALERVQLEAVYDGAWEAYVELPAAIPAPRSAASRYSSTARA